MILAMEGICNSHHPHHDWQDERTSRQKRCAARAIDDINSNASSWSVCVCLLTHCGHTADVLRTHCRRASNLTWIQKRLQVDIKNHDRIQTVVSGCRQSKAMQSKQGTANTPLRYTHKRSSVIRKAVPSSKQNTLTCREHSRLRKITLHVGRLNKQETTALCN